MTPAEPPPAPLEERRFLEESAARTRELDLKERDASAREREVTAKETELGRSRWLNPLVIGLFAAAVGLIGNVIVALVNDRNTQKIERIRAQSSLVLDAIRTGTGNTDAACKNLLALVGLGLLDDASHTIQQRCDTAPAGPPSLPAQGGQSGAGTAMGANGLLGGAYPLVDVSGTVVDELGNGIAGANLSALSMTGPASQDAGGILGKMATTDSGGAFVFHGLNGGIYSIFASKDGFEANSQSVSAYFSGTNVIRIVLKRKK
jgi:hypothetical protein